MVWPFLTNRLAIWSERVSHDQVLCTFTLRRFILRPHNISVALLDEFDGVTTVAICYDAPAVCPCHTVTLAVLSYVGRLERSQLLSE